MKKAKVVFNKGYYIGDNLQKEFIKDTTMYLIASGIVKLGIDNTMTYYKPSNEVDKISIGTLEIEKKYRRTEAIIKNFEELEELSEFDRINIHESIGIWMHEKDFFECCDSYINLFFYPIDLFYEKFTIKVYPIAKVFDDGNIIFSYNVYFNEKISDKKFCNIANKIEAEEIIGVNLPTSYLKDFKYDKVEPTEVEENGEKISYIHLSKNELFINFINVSDFLLKYFSIVDSPSIFYSRIMFLINDEKINKKTINCLLLGCNEPTKDIDLGKDLRLFKDYNHYVNSTSTVIIGKNATSLYSPIQVEEEYMILQTMKDSIIFSELVDNKYSFNKLKEIQLDYMTEENHYFYSNYGEVSEIIKKLHLLMGREHRMKNISYMIERKIKEKEMEFQDRITLLLFLMGSLPIAEYIAIPLLKIYYDYICFQYNVNWLNFFCFSFSMLFAYSIYRKTKKQIDLH